MRISAMLCLLAATALATGLLVACSEEDEAPAGLTLKNVVELLELGYSDADVQKELTKNGAEFELDTAAEKQLRDAGAGDGLIAFLRGRDAATAKSGVDVFLAAARSGTPVEQILDRIAASPRRTLTDAERSAVESEGVPLPVRLALLGRPLALDDLDALAGDGSSLEVYLKVLGIVGSSGEKIPAPRAIALLRAGVPKSVLAEFRKGEAAKTTAPIAGAETPSGPAIRESAGAQGYLHIGRRFRMRCPETWTVLRDIEEGRVRYVFTPETGKDRIDDVDTGIVLTMGSPPEGSVWSDKPPRDLLERMLPWIRVAEPDMALVGGIENARLGSLPAASQMFEGTPRNKTDRFRSRIYVAEKDGLVYSAVAIAPAGSFEEQDEPLRRILENSEFGRLGHAGRGEEVDASALSEKYKASIVVVNASTGDVAGSGSGFIISRDGYILTNYHVIWNSDTDRPHEKVTIRWDDSLRKQAVEAELIGAYHRFSSEALAGGTIGGTDVALLKIPAGDYLPTPLTPLSEVRLGDPVVSIGFAQTGRVANLSLFVTRGVVVRFNRDAAGRSQSITTDAKIAPGNSGGPCFDLRTGGVIGLNTWAYKIGSNDLAGHDARDMVGYYFLCPTDDALANFPLVADLGLSHDAKLDLFTEFELAGQFLALASPEQALKAADRAVELDPRHPDALVLRGFCQQALAMEKLGTGEKDEANGLARQAEASFERALILDPQMAEARIAMASLLDAVGRTDDAAKHAGKAVAAFPDRWDAHLVAARIAAERKKYEEAMREIEAAKRASRNLIPDPYVLAGNIAYSRSWWEEGKQEFEEAVRIHPLDLEARLGVADFYRAKERYDEAIAEYEKIRGDFQASPWPLQRIAVCLGKKKEYDEATTAYLEAEDAFIKNGITPPSDFYLEMVDILEAQDKKGSQIAYLAKHLALYEELDTAVDIHLRVAALFRDLDANGCSTMHVRRAVLLAKARGKELKPEGFPEFDPGVKHIALMAGDLGYDPVFLADLVIGCRLSYKFPTEPKDKMRKEYVKLVRELSIPEIVVDAIIESNKRYPPKATAPTQPGAAQPGAAQPGGTQPGTPAPQENPLAKQLVGAWFHESEDPLLGKIKLTMTFTANGQWSSRGVTGGFQVDDGGTYTVHGNTIRTVIQRSSNPGIRPGSPGMFQFDIQGDILKLTNSSSSQFMEFRRR